eukprot:TRINITY_DN3700_c1_g1_i2.p1 TRINITY_DN3700_c1_g1~~TRINITY_DN3700_c1_g1_i2.p1  ORF type:complete len:955 (+),score=244.92 TRINITY_DN3700_c1_g1_i2:106-2970(+)
MLGAALCALLSSSASLQIGADSGREVVNFDFAWRVKVDPESPFHGTCNLTLDKQESKAQCLANITYGCVGAHALEVTKGCRGTFVCNGKTVECASGGGKPEVCACDGPAPTPAPPLPLPPQATTGYNDQSWELVDCPHDFLITGNFSQGASNKQAFLYRGSAWYRKHFRLPAEWKGSAVWIYIEGSFHKTKSWVNGVPIGTEHDQGYTSFWLRLDDIAQVNYGDQENVLALRVNASTGTGWWYEGGGLTRHVWLVRTDSTHFTPDSSWVFMNVTGAIEPVSPGTPSAGMRAASSVARISSTVRNGGAAAAAAAVSASVVNAAGAVVGTGKSSPVSIAAGSESAVEFEVTIGATELWSVARPYLYTVRLGLSVGGGDVDAVNVTTGARTIRFDANTGFYLNEKAVKLRGFCDHSNFGGVGAAVPDRVNLFRAQYLRTVGGNAWRMAHNPPVPVRLDIMDRIGVIAMDENRDYGGHLGQGGVTDETWQQEVVDMGDMVKRDRNHPSIVIWSFCNEVGCTRGEMGEKAAKYFRNITYFYDGTRPVTQNRLASNTSTFYLDVQGLSHKSGSTFDDFHMKNPDKPEMATECCSCLSQRGEDQDFCPKPKDGVTCPGAEYGTFYNNEISQCTATQVAESDSRPFVAGTFIWSGFDYLGESRGWPQIGKCRGTLADLAGFAKETKYWIQAWWLSNISSADEGRPPLPRTTTVFIPETWRAGPNGSPTRTIHVYTNAHSVKLFVNGKQVGAQDMPFFGTAEFTVTYEAGELTAAAYDAMGKQLANFTRTTPGAGRTIRLSIDSPSPLTGTGSALVADGEDVAMLRAEVLQADGSLAVLSNDSLTFRVVSGPGAVIATHNGDPASQEAQHSPTHRAYHGLSRAFVKVTVDAATPEWHRSRLAHTDVDGGVVTAVAAPGASAALSPIVVEVSGPGFAAAQVSIPVTSDLSQMPLAVAASAVPEV